MGTNGQCGIQEQNSLLGPAGQIACVGRIGANIILNFFEYINQRRGETNPVIEDFLSMIPGASFSIGR